MPEKGNIGRGNERQLTFSVDVIYVNLENKNNKLEIYTISICKLLQSNQLLN